MQILNFSGLFGNEDQAIFYVDTTLFEYKKSETTLKVVEFDNNIENILQEIEIGIESKIVDINGYVAEIDKHFDKIVISIDLCDDSMLIYDIVDKYLPNYNVDWEAMEFMELGNDYIYTFYF